MHAVPAPPDDKPRPPLWALLRSGLMPIVTPVTPTRRAPSPQIGARDTALDAAANCSAGAPPTWTAGLTAPPIWANSPVGIMRTAARTKPLIERLPNIFISPGTTCLRSNLSAGLGERDAEGSPDKGQVEDATSMPLWRRQVPQRMTRLSPVGAALTAGDPDGFGTQKSSLRRPHLRCKSHRREAVE